MTEDEIYLREQIIGCTRCELHASCTAPVPFSGGTPARIVVLGEAPGRNEDKQGEPFIGRAGDLIRENLKLAGFDPQVMTYMNTVSCFPDGTPKPEHIAACRVNKLAQIDLAEPEWVLVLGGIALSGFRPDLKISKARGRVFRPEGADYCCFPSYHPAFALRNRLYEKELLADLVTFKKLTDQDISSWSSSINESCVQCGGPLWWLDAEGIAYCEQHMPEEGHERRRFLVQDLAAARKRVGR